MSSRRFLPLLCLVAISTYSIYLILFHFKLRPEDVKLPFKNKELQLDKKKDGFTERRRLLGNACNTLQSSGRHAAPSNGEKIIINLKHNVGYCSVPKIGSSFWFSVFAILEGRGVRISNPEKLANLLVEDVHKKVHVHYFSDMSGWSKNQFLKSGQLFLFTRNPYQRLLSAYVSKFLSPNSKYWKEFGTTIIKKYRPSASGASIACGHDVTFTEFLRFVIDNTNADPHWSPISSMCSPCHYKYNFIGHLETFAHDTKELIRQLNLSGIITFDSEEDTHVRFYMSNKIKQFLFHFNSTGFCVQPGDLIGRLWKTFKAKGYVKMADNIPTESLLRHFNNFPKFEKTVIDTAFTRYKKLSAKEKQLNSEQFSIEMYKKVPHDTLKAIQRKYWVDFMLFGYEIDSL